jgi:hypothetical protein
VGPARPQGGGPTSVIVRTGSGVHTRASWKEGGSDMYIGIGLGTLILILVLVALLT